MARPQSAAEFDKKKVVAENRRARFDFAIEQVFEAGNALQGTEGKSLRFGEGTIAESYAEGKVDRKSVEKGKSVSVRVRLGGRRSMKKKNVRTLETVINVNTKY